MLNFIKMGLENKGNVVVDLKDKSGLKEGEKKKIIDSGVTEENLDSFSFDKFDEAIEKSFQDFLKTITINSHDDTETIQMQFNNWLDDECKELDIMKDTEIDEKIIKPVSFELVKEATKTELEDLQKELLEAEKKKTETSVDITVNEKELKGLTKLYNGVTKQEIVSLFDKNFDGKDHLLDLLKEKKPGNIKKFQRIIAGIKEDDSSEDKATDTKEVLGNTGVDGMFGIYTLNAFKKYVEKYSLTEVKQDDESAKQGADSDEKGDMYKATVNKAATMEQAPTTGSSPKYSEVVTPVSEIKDEDISGLKEIDEKKAKEIVDAGKDSINLDGLKEISKEVAEELAKFEGTISLAGLENLDPEVVKIFMSEECKCNKIEFQGGTIERGKDDNMLISGKDFSRDGGEIDENLCDSLIAKKSNVSSPKNSQSVPASTGTSTSGGSTSTKPNNSSSTNKTVKQGNKGTQSVGKESDVKLTVKPSEGSEEIPEGYVLLSSLNLSLEEIEGKKEDYLVYFGRRLQDLLGKGNSTEDAKQNLADRIAKMFVPGGTVTYKNQTFDVQDLYSKIKDGTIDIAWNNVQVDGTVSKYAQVIEGVTREGTEKRTQVFFSNVTISEKTGNTSSGTEGAGDTNSVVTGSTQTEVQTETQTGAQTETEENDTEKVEGYAKSKLGRSIGLLSVGKTEVSEVIKMFETPESIVTYKNENMSAEEFLNKVKKNEIKMIELNNLTFDVILAKNSTPDNPIVEKAIFSDSTKEDVQNNSTDDVEIVYTADEIVSGLKKARDAKSEKDALELLLGLKVFKNVSEDLSYSIEGYEIPKQEKKDLKRLRKALRLFTNGKETNVTITDFFKLASEQYSAKENFDLSKLGKEPSNQYKHGGTVQKYEEFGELYSKYRGKQGGPYFQKVMGVMDNYFLRGDVDEKSITDLYNKVNIGTWEKYVDPEKEKQVFKCLFDGKDGGVDLGVPYQSSDQLKQLEKIVKKIGLKNFNELFQSGKLNGNGESLTKREKPFYDLYQSFKKGELQGDDYYKKVFEFLVGVGRGNGSVVDSINAINLIKDVDIKFDDGEEGIDTKDEMHYNSEGEKKFISLLADFSHNGKVDVNDSGIKMGQQIKNIYKSVNVDLNNAGLDEDLESGGKVWSNIVSFAKQYFNNVGNPDMAKKLEGISSIEDMNSAMEKDHTILLALQNMLKNSSISINSIFKYGDRASEMFMNELMGDTEMDKQYNEIFDGWVEQGIVKDDPTIRKALKPIVLGSLMDNSVGIGLGAAYDAGKIGTFSAVLGVADVPGAGATAGLVVGYGNSVPLGDKWSFDFGASGGLSFNQGFVPMFSVYAGTSVRVSDGAMRKDFDVTNMKKIHVGANFTMIGTIPSVGVSAGVSMDRLSGIDKQESMLRPNITSVISEFLNDTEITSIIFGSKEITDEQKQKCISNIREKLGNKYGKMDKDLLDTAANRIYTGFAYYAAETDFANKSEEGQKAIKDKILNNIVNNYVTQWRNDKIEELNGTTKVSDVTVGVQFLADYWPIPMLGVTFTKYKNLYSKETPESIAEYESRLSSGQGMSYLENSVDKENGNITKEAINYLNEKLSIATNYDLQKMKIQFKEMTEDGGTKNVVFIPRELCNSVNISLDPKMENFVKSTPEGFEIPVNTQLSLLTYSRTDATKFNLVIGDYKKEDGDIDINIKSEFEGDPMKYENKEGRQIMTKSKINEDMSKLYAMEDFPLSECVDYKDGKAYFEARVNEIECSGSVSFKDGKLIVPNGRILEIKKTLDGKYTAECDSTVFLNTPGIKVTYIDEKKVQDSQQDVDTSRPIENMFESYKELNSIFDGIEKALSKMDDRAGHGAYAAFMNAAAEAGLDGELDNTDYDTAFKKLKKILGKLKDNCFDGLRGKLEDPNITDGEKVMIVDRFKAIFSYNDNLVNKNNLELQLKGRGNKYKELYGYDKNETFPLTSDFDYRKAVQDRLNEKGTFKKEPNQNLVGMTAFYRLGDKNAGRSYMMTELGGTNVLGGEMIPITDAGDLKATKEWFAKNLEKSGVHKDLLRESLSTKLKQILNIEELSLSNEDLMSLFEGNNIDIGTKKIKINMQYVFYLLGECANESIGVNLKEIVVTEKKGDGTEGTTTVDIKPDVTYEGVSGVYSGSAEAASRYEIGSSESMTIGFAVGKGKQTETEEVIGKDHTEPGENQDPSNNQTEVNENIDPNNNEGGGINLGGESNDQIQIEHEQNNGGLIGHGPGNNGETGSFFGREPRLDPNGGGINLGGEMPTLTPGTYEFTDNLGSHVVTITETEDSYIVHTVTTPLPQHGHALTASQSETHSETKVVKKEK